MGCNQQGALGYWQSTHVSVPSTGRSGLQHLSPHELEQQKQSFSTLYGSKWVATAVCVFQTSALTWFQYPLRVEVGCNPARDAGQHTFEGSFSTLYGSKWVATALLKTFRARFPSFSTLYGSKWVATGKLNGNWCGVVTFQYPLRVEVGCNTQIRTQRNIIFRFQYPLRVEVGCNRHPSATGQQRELFQYPLRVEVGCNNKSLTTWHMRGRFQYPLRVEVGCNNMLASQVRRPVQVSVPSTGRSGLQLGTMCRRRLSLLVSVPSTGRSGLQPAWLYLDGGKSREFQYPLRVEVGCNLIVPRFNYCYQSCFSTLYGSKWVATSSVSTGKRSLPFCFSTLYGSKWVATAITVT